MMVVTFDVNLPGCTERNGTNNLRVHEKAARFRFTLAIFEGCQV